MSTRKPKTGAPSTPDLQFLAGTAGVLIVVVSRDLGITEWNLEAGRLYGRARDEVLGAPFCEVCVPEPARARVREELSAVDEGRPWTTFEISRREPSGTIRWVRWSATLLPAGEEGGRLFLVGQDITEVREGQIRLDGIIHSAMDAIITIDEEQRITLFNAAAEQMFRRSADEVLGSSIDQLIPERFRQIHRQHVKAFGATHVTNRSMGRLGTIFALRADRVEFPVEAAISQVEVGGQKLFTVILRDITARLTAEQSLQKERDFVAAVLDTAGAVVVVLDPEGRVQRFNRACQEITGYTVEEVKGRKIWEFLLKAEDVDPVKAAFREVGRTAVPHHYENDWVGKDGRTHRIAWSNTVLYDASGTIECVIATGVDISALVQTQAQLRQTERLAEIGIVASGLAHEIGTPMNVIMGRAEYLLKRTADETMQKGLSTIIRQVERITKIMNQLLAYARRRPPEPKPTDLRRAIEDSVELIAEKLSRNRIRVDLEISEPLPHVQVDPDHLSQVLLNLLLNSTHAMPDGGLLRIRAAPTDGSVTFAIADTGHGIAKEHLCRIFEPFFTTKEVGVGTGLGLNVVAGIVEEHSGSIRVESEPGQGATFTITLPAASQQGV